MLKAGYVSYFSNILKSQKPNLPSWKPEWTSFVKSRYTRTLKLSVSVDSCGWREDGNGLQLEIVGPTFSSSSIVS